MNLLRLISITAVISMFSTIFAAPQTDWGKHYKLISEDITSILRLNRKSLSIKIRLFKLYGERMALLVDKEAQYKILGIKKNGKRYQKILRIQKQTLGNIDALAEHIEKRTKDKNT